MEPDENASFMAVSMGKMSQTIEFFGHFHLYWPVFAFFSPDLRWMTSSVLNSSNPREVIFSIPKWFILEQMTVNGAWSKIKLKSNLKLAGSTDILSSDNLIYIYIIYT